MFRKTTYSTLLSNARHSVARIFSFVKKVCVNGVFMLLFQQQQAPCALFYLD